MEKNQVLIDLNDYNNLRDFKKLIEADHTISVSTTTYWNNQQCQSIVLSFISKDDAIKQIDESKKLLQRNYDDLIKQKDDQIYYLRKQLKINQEISVDDIKKMSYWEFRKWKKSH